MENINSEIKDSSVFSRTDLNKLFLCEGADFDYTGEIDDTLLFLQDTHLKNRKMWALFVSQYRVHLDTPSSEKNGTGKWFRRLERRILGQNDARSSYGVRLYKRCRII